MKAHLAADRGHTEGIAVATDAGDDAADQRPRLRMLRIAERQRVEAGDRPRPHGEDIAQNAADAGGRALIGLDVAWMVVALHLEHDGLAVADVDDAGILARPLDDPGRLGRQRAQMDFRGFVRAVLVPHRREDAELGEARDAPDQLDQALVLVRLEAVLGDEGWGDGRFVRFHGHRSSWLFRQFHPSWPGSSRPSTSYFRHVKTWMPGTRPGMTGRFSSAAPFRPLRSIRPGRGERISGRA